MEQDKTIVRIPYPLLNKTAKSSGLVFFVSRGFVQSVVVWVTSLRSDVICCANHRD